MLKPIINDAEPMPTKGSFRESKYQWLDEVEVGQSFDVDSDADFNRVASAAKNLVSNGNLPEGYRISRRKIGSTIRIYRTA
jgi:phosphoribosylformylglycinamidine (FGAM) synthase PurS component